MENENELSERIASMERKIDAMSASVEKLRKYFKWTLIITIAAMALPALGLLFVIPYYLKTLTATSPAAFGL